MAALITRTISFLPLLLLSLLFLEVVFLAGRIDAQAPNIYFNLSTKTPYYPQQTAYDNPPASCVPIHIEYLSRHGSREPTKSGIQSLEELATTLHTNAAFITNPAYAWMKTWQSPYARATAGELVIPTGADELYTTAKRMLNNYPSVVGRAFVNYTPSTFNFQSTQVPRTGQSGSAFIYGLFEGRGDLGACNFMPYYIYSNSTDTDLMLRWFDNCPNYRQNVEENPVSYQQSEEYIDAQFPAIAAQVAVAIGAFPEWEIPKATLASMWTACQYEVVIANDTSLFCSLFNESSVAVFNYADDLEYYYVNGPGNALSYQPAYLLLQDMLEGLQCAVNCQAQTGCPSNCSSRGYSAKMRFAHAETVMPLVSLLSIFDDGEPLQADWTAPRIANRKWKTSIISPFAANDNFVLYQCTDSFLVKYLHNEKEYQLPGCEALYCDFDNFVKVLKPLIDVSYGNLCNYSGCSKQVVIHETQAVCGTTVAIVASVTGIVIVLLLIALIALNYPQIVACCCNKQQIDVEYDRLG